MTREQVEQEVRRLTRALSDDELRTLVDALVAERQPLSEADEAELSERMDEIDGGGPTVSADAVLRELRAR